MKTKATIVILLTVTQFLTRCSTDEGLAVPDIVENIAAVDVSNDESSTDIYFKIVLNSLEIDEIRLLVVPLEDFDNIDSERLRDLDTDRYVAINPRVEFQNSNTEIFNYRAQMESIRDVNGNEISNGRPYAIGVLLQNSSRFLLSAEFADIELTDVNPLIGKYRGHWSDNLYNKYPNSMEIVSGGAETLTGVYYYTSQYKPCCNGAQAGAENDGRITLVINAETKEIVKFTFNQVLLTFQGGCNGHYTGSGTFDKTSLLINFTGRDCEGPHTDGVIVMNRDF